MDNETDLMWEKKTEDGGLRDYRHGYSWFEDSSGYADPRDAQTDTQYAKPYGYHCSNSLVKCNTKDFIQAVNKQKLCGYNNWRLPSKDELIVMGKKQDKKEFFDLNSFYLYWSNLLHPYDEYHKKDVWCVHFYVGYSSGCGKDDANVRVRAVRSGQ